jgi:hypothetical protein
VELLLGERAQFDLAQRMRTGGNASLGEVFSFVSGLYFRGKLTYAQRFAQPPRKTPGILVITPGMGLRPPNDPVDGALLRELAGVRIDASERRYLEPLLRDAQLLAQHAPPRCEFVLLGSIATAKYVEPLLAVFGSRLLFPAAFVGRGDMSRGGLMLRAVAAETELEYIPVLGAKRHGPRPARLG